MINFNKFLPYFLVKRLWGDRKKYGSTPFRNDSDWSTWQKLYVQFNEKNQNRGVGFFVNKQGYKIAAKINFRNKSILEFGPGKLLHSKYWSDKPKKFIIVDVHAEMANMAERVLIKQQVNYKKIIVKRNEKLKIPNESVDLVSTFFALEHIENLDEHLRTIKKVLRPNGILFGAIPLEGGLAWGTGRYFTTRKWFKKKTLIDPDKIICWEHPNFASKIISELDKNFKKIEICYWPFGKLFPSKNFNLVCSFIYRNVKNP